MTGSLQSHVALAGHNVQNYSASNMDPIVAAIKIQSLFRGHAVRQDPGDHTLFFGGNLGTSHVGVHCRHRGHTPAQSNSFGQQLRWWFKPMFKRLP